MDEAEAKRRLNVPRETMGRLEDLAALLATENDRQNLVSRGSLGSVWARHIYDSAQLLRFAPGDAQTWLDLGTGAGFPGLVVALLHPARVTMVESRRLRADFLAVVANRLGISAKVAIICSRLEAVPDTRFEVISARAFAPLRRLLPLAERFSSPDTVWLLPKGRAAKSELEAVRASWQGEFRIEPSLTDADAGIIVARQVRRRGKGKSAR